MSVTHFYLDDKLTFGKYKGQIISEIMEKDPNYLDWCNKNISWLYVHFEDRSLNENEVEEQDEETDGFYRRANYEFEEDQDELTFLAMTDGMYGSYYDFRRGGMDSDDFFDGIGY